MTAANAQDMEVATTPRAWQVQPFRQLVEEDTTRIPEFAIQLARSIALEAKEEARPAAQVVQEDIPTRPGGPLPLVSGVMPVAVRAGASTLAPPTVPTKVEAPATPPAIRLRRAAAARRQELSRTAASGVLAVVALFLLVTTALLPKSERLIRYVRVPEPQVIPSTATVESVASTAPATTTPAAKPTTEPVVAPAVAAPTAAPKATKRAALVPVRARVTASPRVAPRGEIVRTAPF